MVVDVCTLSKRPDVYAEGRVLPPSASFATLQSRGNGARPSRRGICPDPKTLKLLGQAFDEAWQDIAGNYDAASVEDRRHRLAEVIFTLARDGERDLNGSRAKRWRSCGARSSAVVTEAFSRSPSEMARRRPACACEYLQLARSKPSRPVRSSGAMVPLSRPKHDTFEPGCLACLDDPKLFLPDAIDCRPTVSRETSHMAIGRNPAIAASCAAAPVIDPATLLLRTDTRVSRTKEERVPYHHLPTGCRVSVRWTRPAERTNARRKDAVMTVDLETLSWFPLSALRPSNRYLFKSYRKGVIRCAYEQ